MLLFCLILSTCLTGCKKKEPDIRIGGFGVDFGKSSTGDAENTTTVLDGDLYILNGIDEVTQTISFLRLTNSLREYVVTFDGTTLIYDRFGGAQTISELTKGDVYELDVDPYTQHLRKMNQSNQVWYYEDVTKYELNLEKDMITVGNTKYELQETVPVYDGEEGFTREQIGESDVLTLIGVNKKIVAVEITTAHGNIQFLHTEKFKNGYFVLGNVAAARIEEAHPMSVRAGTYLLQVAGNGQSGSKEITIESGKTTKVDLRQFESDKNKMCVLSFDMVQPDVTVTINGKVVDTTQVLKLKQGTYRIIAKADGYNNWSRLVMLSSDKVKLTINLEDTTTNTASQSSSGSSSSSSSGGHSNSSNSNNVSGSGTTNYDTDQHAHSGSGSNSSNSSNSSSSSSSSSGSSSSSSSSSSGTSDSTNSIINEVVDLITGN